MIFKERLSRWYSDILFRNSFYLMLATAVLSLFGFFFWLVTAKNFSTADMGVATALVSAMNLIAYLSLMGFNAAFVRFTPTAQDKNGSFNTGLIIAAAASLVISVGFTLVTPLISPHFALLWQPKVAAGFALFCVATTLNLLTDSVFIANREPKYILLINAAYGAVKIALPLLFIAWGAFGIITAAAIGQALGLLLSIAAMMLLFDYRPQLTIKPPIIEQVWRYCAGNYVGSVFNLLPATLLPLIILSALGPESAAYFYIAMMLGNLLYVIPWSITRSMFAESSHKEATLGHNAQRSMLLSSALLLPAVLFVALLGHFILQIFGPTYAEAASLLVLLAFAGFAVAAFAVVNTIFLVTKQTREMIVLNAIFAVGTLALTYALLPLGLFGVGVAWIAGNVVAASVGYVMYRDEILIMKWRKGMGVITTIVYAKARYVRARIARGEKRTILFYPHKPQHFHILYSIVHELGYAMSTNPDEPHELAIAFEDKTVRTPQVHEALKELARNEPVVNLNCADISKENIERIFSETYGYATFVDPETYAGTCVRKSNDNSTHDGRLIDCPSPKEPGYVYQKFIDSEYEGHIVDFRGIVMGGKLRYVTLKYKVPEERFDVTSEIHMHPAEALFSPQEIERIEAFCDTLGFGCGEMDILRDKSDGRIYIIDVSNTSGGPVRNLHISSAEHDRYLRLQSDSFAQAYGLAGNKSAVDSDLSVVVQ